MEPKGFLEQLKCDFESSQNPQWYDEHTTVTLDSISNEMRLGRITWNEFRHFVEDNFGQGDFAWGCLQHVKQNI